MSLHYIQDRLIMHLYLNISVIYLFTTIIDIYR